MKAIGGRLVAGQTLTDSDLSLGDRVGQLTAGVASTAGAAAGAVATAPLAVIEPKTRRGYGDQLGDVGAGIEDTFSSVRPDIKRRGQASTVSSAGSNPSNSARTR